MKVTVCVGSSCHVKGAGLIVEKLVALTEQRGLSGKIDLSGAFCMGNCMGGVCVTIDGEMFSLKSENAASFFENQILTRL